MNASRMLAAFALAALAACASTAENYDYTTYLAHMPRSILVLPPLDESPETTASYDYLSTVTAPLAERGYYVFPVAVVDAMMRENGLPTPGEMHQVSLAKLGEVFGADAVLYLTVKEWGTSYNVLESATTVSVEGRLVDVGSGEVLWQGARAARASSNDGNQGGIAGMLIGALVNQVATSAYDESMPLARQTSAELFGDDDVGLLRGAYHPQFAEDQAARRAAPPAAQAPAAAATP